MTQQTSPKLKSNDDIPTVKLQTATKSTVYNIALQITLRIVTFIANAFILRFISKDILGIINVRLLLLYSTIQFISREPFRRTCVSNSEGNDEKSKQTVWRDIVNLTSLTVPIAIVTGLLFSTLWFFVFERPDEHLMLHYQYGIIAIYFSVIIELFAESFFIYGQRNDFIRVKVIIEGIFQMVRCLLHSASVYYSPHNAIFGFAFAQVIASSIYSLCYIYYFVIMVKIPIQMFIPTYFNRSGDSKLFCPVLVRTSYSFFKNTALKQFLTEGERYLMTMFSMVNFAEQGIFDVINNLGSLPARIIFQQIEENGYLLFSSLIKREIDPNLQKSRIVKSLYICSNLVKLMFLIGLFIFVYGYHCGDIALFLYGGHSLISGSYGNLAVTLFQWQCLYIVFIALNGILESYSFAAMSVDKLNNFNYKMVAVSAMFTIFSFLATSFIGSVGFIIANCFNMSCRIVISLVFIGTIIPESSIIRFLKDSSPSVKTATSFAICAFVMTISKSRILPNIANNIQMEWINIFCFISIVGLCFCFQLCLLYIYEKDLVQFTKRELLSKSKQS